MVRQRDVARRERRDAPMDAALAVMKRVRLEMMCEEPMTLRDIAEVCGVRYQTIQQIEARAKEKMRARLLELGIDGGDVR